MVAQLAGFVAKVLNLQYHPLWAVLLRMYPFFSFCIAWDYGSGNIGSVWIELIVAETENIIAK